MAISTLLESVRSNVSILLDRVKPSLEDINDSNVTSNSLDKLPLKMCR